MKSGTIKLLYQEKVIKQIEYYSLNERRDTIVVWKQLTGIKFDECVIQIRPNISKSVQNKVYAM